ncbi:transcription factor bHLH47-like [Pistacia vera]|uniref:transcription factor bHLH47 n=1 Tax=Pistacia vera TaxID=55513 RepID=UPI001262AFD0|nr:transcription factor bHLH47 [Pistacia vera]XP_031280071.1 transcription factor bHLH47-like [Pistacia vera]
MGSEDLSPLVDEVNVLTDPSIDRPCPTKKNQGKAPRRIHKAEREKMKREHLNELFIDLANALELNQQNSGKASILCEATRLLKDLFGQIDSLRKENASLLSESRYVSVEKNELEEENSTLESQIEKLQSEIEARVAHSKPDLNVPPPESQASHFPGDSYGLSAVEPALQQASAVYVVPIRPELQAYSTPDSAQLSTKPASNVSKPHARYPTSADSWPSQLLGESICSSGNKAPSDV